VNASASEVDGVIGYQAKPWRRHRPRQDGGIVARDEDAVADSIEMLDRQFADAGKVAFA